jgi:lipase
MRLETHSWGAESAEAVVCLHGLNQNGRIFEPLGKRLAQAGRFVVALDLRGHGGSGIDPPWNVDTHAADVLSTVRALGIERVSWVGHSFGGRVAASLAASEEELTVRVALLDPGLQVPVERALRAAEIERRDWSFASVEAGVRAVLANELTVAAPEAVVTKFAEEDMCEGPDGRLRFGCCPSAVVTGWSELTLPPPPVARCPTLIVHAAVPLSDGSDQRRRYAEALGGLLTVVEVPNGHNVMWESPNETVAAIERFLE